MSDRPIRILYTGPDIAPLATLGDEYEIDRVSEARTFDVASACNYDIYLIHEDVGVEGALSAWLNDGSCRAPTVVLCASDCDDTAAAYVRDGAVDVLSADGLRAPDLVRALRLARARHAAANARAWENERYRLMIEHTHDVVCVVDGYGRFTYVSPSIREVQGGTPEDLVGQNAFAMIHDDDVERVLEVFMEAVAEPGTVRALSYRIVTTDGRARWMEGVGRSIIGPDGHPYGVINARDVTERKEAEVALRASEAHYRALTHALPDVISRIALDGTVLDYHLPPSFATETAPESLVGRRLQDTVEPYLADLFDDAMGRLEGSDGPVTYRYEVLLDGASYHREVRITRNGPDEVLSILRDVTTEVKTEAALRAQEEFLHQVVSRVPVIVFALDPEARFTLAVGQGLERVNVTSADLVGRPAVDILADFPDMLDAVNRALGGKTFETTVALGRRSLEVYVAPVHDVAGRLVRVIGVAADVTEMREKQEALARSQDELRELAAHLQEVREEERRRISREVHDVLGQALTAIRLGVGWVGRRMEHDAEAQERVADTQAHIDRTIQRVRDIASQLRPGLLDDFGLGSAMEWQALEFEKQAGVTCTVRVEGEEEEIPEDVATNLFRVFQETLTNVARHAKASSVEATLRVEARRVVLQVRDDGVGIEPEALAEGRTLGLIGIRERALALGGVARLTGAPGDGTSVEVEVPLALPAPHSLEPDTPEVTA